MGPISLRPEQELSPWLTSLCFTGHRPEKLPRGSQLTALIQTLHHYIDRAAAIGFTHYYIGMADGIDYLAAEYLFDLRRQNPSLCVICVQPCEDYKEFFQRRGYNSAHLSIMQHNADKLVVLPGSWREKGIFLKRNYFMVDHSTGIIAVCAEGRSGSMQAYRYAQKRKLAYCRIFPKPTGGVLLKPEEWPVELNGF